MQHTRHRHFRNQVDMADRVQVRVIKRRLRLSESELSKLVDRVGNSIAAISKEAALRKAMQLDPPRDLPRATTIAVVAEQESENRTEQLSPAS